MALITAFGRYARVLQMVELAEQRRRQGGRPDVSPD
jgi:hypothetical protein